MRDKPTLSVCMIVKDEADKLPDAIGSVRKIADQVVVVDTGSTDSTVEVARTLGAAVSRHEWRDDFAEARNRSLAEAQCDWILCLDADEILVPESRDKLLRALSGAAAAYMVRIESRVDSTAGKVFVNFFPRLFKNLDGIRFEGKVHEQVSPSLKRLGLSIEVSGIVLRHTGYALSESGIRAKAQRNADLLHKEMEEHPNDALTLFHLAEAFSMLARFDEAAGFYDKALAVGGLDTVVRAAALQNRGTALVKLKEYENALISLKQAGEVDPGLLTVHLVTASALYGMGKFDRAAKEVSSYINTCRDIERVNRVTLGHDPDIPNALVLLAKCHLAQGRLPEARQALDDALRADHSCADAHVLLGRIAFEELKFGQAASHLEEAIEYYPREQRLRFELARAHAACGSNDKAIKALTDAIESGMEGPDLLRCLGILKIKKKDFAGAIGTYQQVLRIDPADIDARRKLAGLYQAQGNTKLAEETLTGVKP